MQSASLAVGGCLLLLLACSLPCSAYTVFDTAQWTDAKDGKIQLNFGSDGSLPVFYRSQTFWFGRWVDMWNPLIDRGLWYSDDNLAARLDLPSSGHEYAVLQEFGCSFQHYAPSQSTNEDGRIMPGYLLAGEENRIGTARGLYAGTDQLSWILSRFKPNDDANSYILSYSLCRHSLNMPCGNNGVCANRPAEFAGGPDRRQARLDAMVMPDIGAKVGHGHRLVDWPSPWFDVYDNDDHFAHAVDNVRGCICNSGYSGLHCSVKCPPASELCMGHGTCSGVGVTDAQDSTCVCSTGCQCASGFFGLRCQFIHREQNAVAFVTDYSVCSPTWAWSDSSGLVNELTDDYCAPLTSQQQQHDASCGTADVPTNGWTARTANPSRCGEDFKQQWYQNDPSYATDQTSSYATAFASLKKADLGRGVCWSDPRNEAAKRAVCWCNPTPAVYSDVRGTRYGRRGFWGDSCSLTTCTQMQIPVVPADALSLASSVLFSPTVTVTAQCNGRAAKSLVGNDHWKSYADASVCLDTFDYGFNAPGTCRECDDGWGAYAGHMPDELAGTAFALPPSQRNGLCAQKTLHSAGGGVCGGYGVATRGSVPMCPRPNDKDVKQFPIKTDNSNFIFWMDCTVPNRTLTPILSCSCPAIYTVLVADSGICQRSCASVSTNSPAVPFSPLNVSANSIASIASTRCSGNGLCRPILDRDAPDGFNSACMCNAGWNGYDCSVRDWRFFDPGTPAEFDRLYVSPAPSLCGLHGMSIVMPSSAGDSRSPDFAYFVDQIATLGQAGGGPMSSVLAYSNNMCACNDDGTALGYAVPAIASVATSSMSFACNRVCTSAELMGAPHDSTTPVSCSGPAQGACVGDPSGLSADKVCLCQLGFSGSNCAQFGPLHDKLGQACGGTDRGIITYKPNTFDRVQRCLCLSPYVVDSNSGLCALPCPTGGPGGDLVCSGPQNGASGLNDATLNDCVCACNPGFAGASCNATTTESNVGQSGLFYACTGHGWPHADGYCVCAAGFVGAACEMDLASRRCGEGQPYIDNYSASIVLSGATQIDAVAASRGTARCGAISMVKMWMVYSLLPNMRAGATYADFDYIRDNYGSAIDLLYLDGGAVGAFDALAHTAAYPAQYARMPSSTASFRDTKDYYLSSAHSFAGTNNGCVKGVGVW